MVTLSVARPDSCFHYRCLELLGSCNFAYADSAFLGMGMPGSASFQGVRKSLHAARS